MPTATTAPAVRRRRFIVTVPALYWDRQDGLVDGYGFQQETRAETELEAIQQVMPELLPRLAVPGRLGRGRHNRGAIIGRLKPLAQ